MKTFRKLTSIMLLFCLGLLLGLQTLKQSSLSFADHSSSTKVIAEMATDPCIDCHIEAGHSDHSEKCSDPCHVGQAHFGHCPFPFSEAEIPYLAVSVSKINVQYIQNALEDPDLASLRRPPRLS